MTTPDTWPKVSVTYDERGIALQSRPDGPTAPIIIDVDTAHALLNALQRAIDDRDRLRGQIDEIHEADPDAFTSSHQTNGRPESVGTAVRRGWPLRWKSWRRAIGRGRTWSRRSRYQWRLAGC
jgi:hypothetical protein